MSNQTITIKIYFDEDVHEVPLLIQSGENISEKMNQAALNLIRRYYFLEDATYTIDAEEYKIYFKLLEEKLKHPAISIQEVSVFSNDVNTPDILNAIVIDFSKVDGAIYIPSTVEGQECKSVVFERAYTEEEPPKREVDIFTNSKIEALLTRSRNVLPLYNRRCNLFLVEGLKHIGRDILQKSKIRHLTIPSTVTSVGQCAFYETDIEHLHIKEGETPLMIHQSAFRETKVKEIVLPKRVHGVGNYAFSEIKELERFTVHDPSTKISPNALYNSNPSTIVYGDKVIQAKKNS